MLCESVLMSKCRNLVGERVTHVTCMLAVVGGVLGEDLFPSLNHLALNEKVPVAGTTLNTTDVVNL
jgi:hypothetical protein